MRWVYNMMKKGIDPYENRDKAAELGTLCHYYIECDIFGHHVEDEMLNKFEFDDIAIAERGLKQFKEIIKKHDIEILESEYPLVSEKYQYGGCIDMIGRGTFNGKNVLFLGDLKTSNSIYSGHLIQISAYRELMLEEGKYNPEELLFFKVSKNKEDILKDDEIVKVIPADQVLVEAGWRSFTHLIELHKEKKLFDKAYRDSVKHLKKK